MMSETANVIPAIPGAQSALPAPLPIVFGPPSRSLFGWYHPARPESVRRTGVVLCPPIGNETLCAHASYRFLAERLAEEGYPALRFDYDGTGDSFGSDEDDDRVQSWLASIGFAIDTLRARGGTPDITLFGVRLGGTLATVAAAERGDVTDLLLWAPCRTGRSYLREMRVLRAAHGQGDMAARPMSVPEYEEAAGFVFTRATVDALNQLDASAISRKPVSHALLIGRDDLPSDERLGERLAALGTAVTQTLWPGYAAMMRDAQDTQIPQTAIDSIIGWLDTCAAPCMECPVTLIPSMASEGASLAAEAYTEESYLRGTDPLCFGILTRPRASSCRSATVVLLLNVGANHHIGPNRMYVALARQLAAQGFLVLRLDIPGVGDSARGAASARQQVYSDSAIQDVHATISHLETYVGAERFVLIGLCSGAYMAYKIASSDPRVSTQILINPQTFEWKEGDSLEIVMRQSYKSTRVYLTSLHSAETLKRMLHRQIDMKGISEVLFRRLIARSGLALKSLLSLALRLKPFETPVCQTFRRIADRGTDTLFIFAAEDIGIEVIALHLGTNARKIRRQKNLSMATIDEADHTFTQKAARETMLSLVVQHLIQRYPECGRVQGAETVPVPRLR